jgi:hypothetical protein
MSLVADNRLAYFTGIKGGSPLGYGKLGLAGKATYLLVCAHACIDY